MYLIADLPDFISWCGEQTSLPTQYFISNVVSYSPKMEFNVKNHWNVLKSGIFQGKIRELWWACWVGTLTSSRSHDLKSPILNKYFLSLCALILLGLKEIETRIHFVSFVLSWWLFTQRRYWSLLCYLSVGSFWKCVVPLGHIWLSSVAVAFVFGK